MSRNAAAWLAALALGWSLVAAGGTTPVQAQAGGRVEAGGGILVGAGAAFGHAAANLTRPSGDALALFRTESRQTRALGLTVHLSSTVAGPFVVEALGTWSRARLHTRVTADLEGASTAPLELPFSRFTVEGALLWPRQTAPHVGWYLRAGGGWLRDVTADGAATAGAIARVGAGVKYWWMPPGGGLRYGVRVEGGVSIRRDGLTLGDGRVSVAPALTAGLIIGS